MNGLAGLPPSHAGMGLMSYFTPAFLISATAQGPEMRNGAFLLKNSGIAFVPSIEVLRALEPFSPMAPIILPAAIDSGESTVTFLGSGSPLAVGAKNEPPPDENSG